MPFGRMHAKIMVQLPKIGVALLPVTEQLPVTAQLPVTVGGARAGA